MDWKDMKKIGTAYITGGKLVWGAELKSAFYCDEYPSGTERYVGFVSTYWCSLKDAIEKRSRRY